MGKKADKQDDDKRAAKAVRMATSTSGHHTAMHKHPRRTSRPIIVKGNKQARIQREAAMATLTDMQKQIDLLVPRIKRLEKLRTRQESSGVDAASTREQCNSLRAEIGQLQEEMRVAAENLDGGTAEDMQESAEK
mmetsp:Transcript_4471/g.11784  ORF Transcript_4471/g.11784 Transcript_4471/m.11784 type:complete len:135 (+) Transcript_4471:52-456(+)|eukprot:CAMPEP_0115853944 /NCGR_PEP_ID=MMETSP0287-20121206/13765_1 /TAXON_ID=412157 /ORGANISM="Chrysochromulina rotalis, Strain UIO044" /LENGTH=134 /DNA_ID=CAMNT_0003308037 /DNA_START=23 /DNA_END=427 /DNA_ORIENTATION=-